MLKKGLWLRWGMLIDVQHNYIRLQVRLAYFTGYLQVVMIYVYGRNCCQTNKKELA